MHFFRNPSDPNSKWAPTGLISSRATGPGSIMQSSFGNFEVVVPEGGNLVHFFKDFSKPNTQWISTGVITQQ
jgi:hypothetical protein